MNRAGSALAAIGLAMLAAAPASACSFSWRPGFSPEEIKARDDMRMVRGTFRFGEFRVETGRGGYPGGWIYGRIETQRGTHWDTLQPYDELSVECGAYRRPTADATGTFWIRRRGRDGRYELMLWEGTFLPRPDPQRQEGNP